MGNSNICPDFFTVFSLVSSLVNINFYCHSFRVNPPHPLTLIRENNGPLPVNWVWNCEPGFSRALRSIPDSVLIRRPQTNIFFYSIHRTVSSP